ncbi:MAG: hypothetical protein JXR40_00045 [Pontiellaceae bacterium]|nr:hypothetical protein [Pontiellaceae bacterium]
MGDGGYNSDQYLGVRRETFLVERAELSPLPVEPDLGIETYIHEHRKWTIVADPEAFVLPGKSLPFVYDTSRFRKDGLELYYPEQECLVNDFRRVYWFVPAKTLDEGPQVALVTEHEWYHAPPYTYPVRAVLLPVALAADCAEGILISPLLFAVYMGWLSPV